MEAKHMVRDSTNAVVTCSDWPNLRGKGEDVQDQYNNSLPLSFVFVFRKPNFSILNFRGRRSVMTMLMILGWATPTIAGYSSKYGQQ